MFDKDTVKQSLTYASLAILYVAAVATFMQNAERIFGPGPDSPLAPVAFLLLLVVSAATMGALIFGKPVMLYIDGRKREAVATVICTIASLAAFTVLLIVAMTATRA